MILSDRDIRAAMADGRIVVDPLGPNAIQPSSVDLRIGSEFRVFANNRYPYIDVRQPMEGLTDLVTATEEEPFILHPGEFVLGTTYETVSIPDDVVARLEGKSSLARLGLLIHSSLPGDEPILFRSEGQTRLLPIGDIVRKQLDGEVVSFDPESFETRYAAVTGWYEGPEDRIHEVRLASGRRVRVTAGHNLFTLDRDGQLAKVRTGELAEGTMVAVPRRIPTPADPVEHLDLRELVPVGADHELVCQGPTVAEFCQERRRDLAVALRDAGVRHTGYHLDRGQLPWRVAAQMPELFERLDVDDRIRVRGSRSGVAVRIPLDEELGWLLGMYVAEGYRRRGQVVVSNTDQVVLDRVEAAFARLGVPTYRGAGAVTAMSTVLSELLCWLGLDGKAKQKRLPDGVFGWPDEVLRELLDGFVDGDGSREPTRTSLWTSSPRLVEDLLLLCARLGLRAGANERLREHGPAFQVSVPNREHKLLATAPLPDRLLVAAREAAGMDQRTAAAAAGYSHPTDLCNLERRSGRDAVRRSTMARLREAYAETSPEAAARMDRLIDGGLCWDRVVEVHDTGRNETIFDLEVRPDGDPIENFLAGHGGVFVSNTAGFVDAGWSGHLTLELSNVANLPITLYPGMKIGQLAFFPLTSPAEHPYGSAEVGSKYQGQRGPTVSRYFENFEDTDTAEPGDAT